ncbi:DMT family transporter [Erwinia sp. MYb375]|uniref:DMT family transporter n=1 Tax=Enterobacter agglomerans TaxID=549 RepID=A0ACC5RQH2_ENTAG|nr:DMT family transporter [Pantoea agglomerans]MBK4726957.1 DMT family transporter [Pantoea agglomerans]
MRPSPSPSTGVSMKIAGALTSTLMMACVKGLDGTIPVGEVIFFRSSGALIPLFIWLWCQGNILDGIRTRNVKGHFLRGLAGTGGLYFSYLALLYISLTDVTAINYAAPLITVIMAAIFLREKVKYHRWVAVIAGFIGILVMMSGQLFFGREGALSSVSWLSTLGMILALMAAVCIAGASIQIRYLNGIEKPGAIAFWFAITTTLTSLFTLWFGWTIPNGRQLMLLLGCGLLGGITQILLTLSLKYADASLLAPFDYSTLIWSVFIGYLFWDTLPELATIFGAGLVVTGGVISMYFERRHRRAITPLNVSG